MREDGYTKEEITARVNKEIARLKRLFKDIPRGVKDSALSLIRNAAFMTITLEDLQESINEKGATSEYKNGENQYGTKKSPEVEVYNAMIKNHMTIMKQLTDLLPDGDKTKTAADELMDFVKKARK